MASIGADVDQVVQEIGCGCRRRKGEEPDQDEDQRCRVERVRGERRHEQQRVLGILMDAQRLHPGARRRPLPGDCLVRHAELANAPAQTAARIDRIGDAGVPPHLQVRGGVADIVEIAGPERIHQHARLVRTGKVMVRRGGEHPVEQAEMTRHRLDLPLVAGAREIDLAPLCLRLGDQCQHGLIVREFRAIEVLPVGQEILERRLAAAQRLGEFHGSGQLRADMGEGGLDQQVRADQCAVEIHDQGWGGIRVNVGCYRHLLDDPCGRCQVKPLLNVGSKVSYCSKDRGQALRTLNMPMPSPAHDFTCQTLSINPSE